MEFNFIATTYKGLEREAVAEVLAVLAKIGDPDATARATEVSGLMVGRTALDATKVPRMLYKMVEGEPWSLRLLLRFIPVEVVVKADLEELAKVASGLARRIGQTESFRVTVEKRHAHIGTKEIIEKVAGVVDRKVDLDDPDWVVLVEVVGEEAGVSVVRPDQVFSSVKAKRA